MSLPRIILASASPRRAELLRAAEIAFEQRPSEVDEQAIRVADHRAFAIAAARAKALDVLSKENPEAIVLGADTIVCVDGDRLGKPADHEDARAMLLRLEGRRHEVLTGLALCSAGHEPLVDCVATAVWFGAIPPDALAAYLDTPEPYDKAGAYAIQGWAGAFIERIEGERDNVIGLPVARLKEMLAEFVT